ncbi:MAG: cyclic pyranopterin monophosphate synthase [Desulfuromonadales bacterium]|jgi:cyclic pyranopterin phosphate synthase|nr:cyclic pyranopterin monophosphate synthase [Desulfuromonadales bacterium]
MSDRLTHLDENGKAVMVEVGEKSATSRVAVARGEVHMKERTLQLIMSGEVAKGDVWAVARVAGIMAAKKTSDLIPLCHPLLLTSVSVDFTPCPGQGKVDIEARVRVNGQTGVEMEALTAVAAAGLAIYDMCKAVDKEMVVSAIRLMEKHGGKSGSFVRSE